ncbi:natriuretic peptide A-like [Salminus brasiliensis]|uniref:natriuretic peptide A-like n=1 Tax=Salminus brasiliensis TaxID=930266 RepID=UPI003B831F1B
MFSSVSVLCLCSLLLLNLAGAKPLSGLQTLKELLEEEQEGNLPYLGTAEDTAMEHRGSSPEEPGNESALERVLGDLLAVSKRSWSRFKKGGLRSCFGVRLERIGSFSGLGC